MSFARVVPGQFAQLLALYERDGQSQAEFASGCASSSPIHNLETTDKSRAAGGFGD